MFRGKSCETCPSYIVDPDRQTEYFGRAIGAPTCAKYGHVLGVGNLTSDELERLAQHFGSECSAHGTPCPSKAIDIALTVQMAEPDANALAEGPTGESCSNCGSCSNMIREDQMFEDFQTGLPLCSVKGIAIYSQVKEAKGCRFVKPGAPSISTTNVVLMPHLRHGWKPPAKDLVGMLRKQQDTSTHPALYETDKPVTDEDTEIGIRAWRKVVNPDDPEVFGFLPIYSPSILNEHEIALIPQAEGEEHIELYVDYGGFLYDFTIEAYELDETPLLIGQPGVGKTEALRWVAYLMQLPFHRFTLAKSTEVDDLIGSPQLADGATYFKEGRLPKAWVRPGVIDLDEINLARGEIREYIRPLIDNSRQFVLDAAGGIIKDRAVQTFLAMTMNPAWDIRNAGTEDFAAADANRLSPIWMENPPPEVERHIVKERCALDGYEIPDKLLDTLEAINEDIRELCRQNQFDDWWGTRQSIKVARKTRWYTLAKAYKRASLDFYEPDVVALVMEAVMSHQVAR